MAFENSNPDNKLQVWIPLLLSLMTIVGMFIGYKLRDAQPEARNTVADAHLSGLRSYSKLQEMLKYIEAKYVDEVDIEKLEKDAIKHLLGQLDPHSVYFDKETLQAENENLDGSFEGIGMEFMILHDTIVVVAPLAGGPAEAAGLLAGDKIVQIGDSSLGGSDLSTGDVLRMLKGKKGTQVKVGVRRGRDKKIHYFLITRDRITLHSVDASYMLEKNIGYIKVNHFRSNTYREFMEQMEELITKEGMDHLVIDLRQNPGGILQEATKILSQLFEQKDKLMVYTDGRKVGRSDYESTGKNFFDLEHIAVLVDEGSASASEIIAGALQDWDRGIVIGRRSFGKGLVQQQYPLKDGSALRLTVARYYTPSGRLIQKPYQSLEDYRKDISNRLENGELTFSDSLFQQEDTTKFYTALGRVVYGSGGISPDIFVPLDSTVLEKSFQQLRQHVPEYVLDNLKAVQVKDGWDLQAFIDQFSISNELFQDFLDFAKKKVEKELAPVPENVSQLLRLHLKARYAKHLFEQEGLYGVLNEEDEVIAKAVKALKSTNPLALKNGE